MPIAIYFANPFMVACSYPFSVYKVRLVDRSGEVTTERYGRLEVLPSTDGATWGSVCDDEFSDESAR